MSGRTRLLAALALSALTLVATSSAAWGHASLDKASVPADSDQRLSIRVPVERFDPPGTHNIKVIAEVPAAFTLTACQPKLGWTCRTEPSDGTRSLAIWERTSGFDAVDLLEFDVHTPPHRGRFAFEINQFYSAGEPMHWDEPEDGEHAAPVLEVTGPDEPVAENPEPAAAHDAPPPAESPAASAAPPSPSEGGDAAAPTFMASPSPSEPLPLEGDAAPPVPEVTTSVPTVEGESAAPAAAAAVPDASPTGSDGGGPGPLGLGLLTVALVAGGAAIAGVTVKRRRRPATP